VTPNVEVSGSPGCPNEDGAGEPPTWVGEAEFLRALRPSHMLFLCVANSARSQMAEGIARRLAPDGVRISSAGSEPSRVRPQAVEVLAEMGIDASEHRSKSLDEFADEDVDCVVIPDPAAATGSDEEVLASFRGVRDEIHRRLALLFGS